MKAESKLIENPKLIFTKLLIKLCSFVATNELKREEEEKQTRVNQGAYSEAQQRKNTTENEHFYVPHLCVLFRMRVVIMRNRLNFVAMKFLRYNPVGKARDIHSTFINYSSISRKEKEFQFKDGEKNTFKFNFYSREYLKQHKYCPKNPS